ncbi:MAG: hypothetical protein IKZ82_11105 [Clostridia bacterium]|nr:hypothetical protein [Clostridia bacterium]
MVKRFWGGLVRPRRIEPSGATEQTPMLALPENGAVRCGAVLDEGRCF